MKYRNLALALAAATTAIAIPVMAQGTQKADPAFVQQLRAALQENPELVLIAAQAAQEKGRQQQQVQMNEKVKEFRPEIMAAKAVGPVLGNPKGTKTVVEFLDYRCHFCQKAHADVDGLVADNKDVRVIVVMRPILGPDSEVLARFALAASLQGKFTAVHDALYEGEVKATDEGLQKIATATGLNWAKAKSDMAGKTVSDELAKHADISDRMQVSGTPFFVTPTTVIPGATDKATLAKSLG